MPDDTFNTFLRDRQWQAVEPARLVGFEETFTEQDKQTAAEDEKIAPPARLPRFYRFAKIKDALAPLDRLRARTSPRKAALALACFVAAIYLLGPRLFFTESERAVTNAPLVTLRPEFFGTVQSVAAVGATLDAGAAIATVTNAAWDPSQLLEVERRLRDAQARQETAEQELSRLRGLRDRLQVQYDVWQRSMSASAALQVSEAEEQLQAAQARLGAAQTNLARYDGLASNALVSLQRLTDIRRDYAVAVRDARAASAAVLVAQQAQETIKAGISLGSNDRPPTLQLMNEIDIHLATESAAQEAAQGDVKTYQAQREEMLRLREQQTHIVLKSPVQGAVWRVFAHPGDAVAAHSPVASLVDCERLGVTAIFGQRHVEAIVPGRRVSVQLVGIDKTLSGHIARVNGYYQSDDREAEAVALKPDETPSVIAWVTLDKPLSGCWIGLEATVRLH